LRLKWNVKGSNYRPEELLLWAMQNSENTWIDAQVCEFVHGLSGRYITAEDVGMETRDMDIVRDVTPTLLEFLKKEEEQEILHLLLLTECTWNEKRLQK
jgi:hypothetical protein